MPTATYGELLLPNKKKTWTEYSNVYQDPRVQFGDTLAIKVRFNSSHEHIGNWHATIITTITTWSSASLRLQKLTGFLLLARRLGPRVKLFLKACAHVLVSRCPIGKFATACTALFEHVLTRLELVEGEFELLLVAHLLILLMLLTVAEFVLLLLHFMLSLLLVELVLLLLVDEFMVVVAAVLYLFVLLLLVAVIGLALCTSIAWPWSCCLFRLTSPSP